MVNMTRFCLAIMAWSIIQMVLLVQPVVGFSSSFLTKTRRFGFGSPSSTTATTSVSRATMTTRCFMVGRMAPRIVAEKNNQQKEKKEKDDIDDESTKKVPITLLGGFLGAGKTTTLQHLLENTEGAKLGIIVNDIASVNIDAKLISTNNNQEEDGVIELQNGCACCSLADELLTSVETLLGSNKEDKNKNKQQRRKFDAIVIELSGVADPASVKSNWKEALMTNHPVSKMAEISQIVTLVDASTFGTDWMSWDKVRERKGWVKPGDECVAAAVVPELLAEQVEAASIVLINKIDLAGTEQTQIASSLVRSLNVDATIEEVQYGHVSQKQIFQHVLNWKKKEDDDPTTTTKIVIDKNVDTGSTGKKSCCSSGKSKNTNDTTNDSHREESSSDGVVGVDDGVVVVVDDDDDASTTTTCTNPACTDPACPDPNCTSSTKTNDVSSSTSIDQLGIVNFVYRADRPFNLNKLMEILNSWPIPIKDTLDVDWIKEAGGERTGGSGTDDNDVPEVEGQQHGYYSTTAKSSPFQGVLRSKGFCWLAPTAWTGPKEDTWRHDTTMYWSHAGKHFSLTTAGKWWDTIDEETMKSFFVNNMNEYARILSNDFVSTEFGDRRQELVFIGVNLNQQAITDTLDDCLVSSHGMDRYRKHLQQHEYRNSLP